MTSLRVQTAERFISHFTTLDEGILETTLADDYTHQYAPSSIPNQGPFDKKGLINFVTGFKRIIKTYPMTIKESIDSESRNIVTVWTIGKASVHDELKDEGSPKEDWEYTGEYMFLLYMNEEGDKVAKTVEFLDSKATADRLIALVARASKNLAS